MLKIWKDRHKKISSYTKKNKNKYRINAQKNKKQAATHAQLPNFAFKKKKKRKTRNLNHLSF